MIHLAADEKQEKGWFLGPWNSAVPVPVGYAHSSLNERHYHEQMHEIYLAARG